MPVVSGCMLIRVHRGPVCACREECRRKDQAASSRQLTPAAFALAASLRARSGSTFYRSTRREPSYTHMAEDGSAPPARPRLQLKPRDPAAAARLEFERQQSLHKKVGPHAMSRGAGRRRPISGWGPGLGAAGGVAAAGQPRSRAYNGRAALCRAPLATPSPARRSSPRGWARPRRRCSRRRSRRRSST